MVSGWWYVVVGGGAVKAPILVVSGIYRLDLPK